MNRLSRVILIADFAVAGTSLIAAFCLRYGTGWLVSWNWSALSPWMIVFAELCLLWSVIYSCLHLDGFRDGWYLPAVTSNLTLGIFVLLNGFFAWNSVTKTYYSRFVMGAFSVIFLASLLAVRLTVRSIMKSAMGSRRRAVIVGNGNVAHELARKIHRHPELRIEVAGFLYPTGSESATDGSTPSTAGPGVPDFLSSSNVKDLIICFGDSFAAETQKLVEACRKQGFRISIVPQWYELYLSKARLLDLEGLPLVSLQESGPSSISFVTKRVLDLLVMPLLCVIALPLIAICVAALRILKGRGLRHEIRCGRDGKEFRMWRLNVDYDAPLGRFERTLLKLSITDLPQLWNVLLGDMTLVGPRPESVMRVRHYSDWQRQRLSVRPGITGLAQVYGLREVHSSEEKARFDLQYISHWTPFMDFALLLQTLWTLARRLGRRRAPISSGAQRMAAGEAITHQPRITDSDIREALNADSTHSCAD